MGGAGVEVEDWPGEPCPLPGVGGITWMPPLLRAGRVSGVQVTLTHRPGHLPNERYQQTATKFLLNESYQ